MKKGILLTLIPCLVIFLAHAQDNHHYQTDFAKEEFTQRSIKIYDAIGNNAIALIQGASGLPGFSVFRQNNTFYYFTGLESPHAYLLLNGKTRRAAIYLPHRDAATESNRKGIVG